MTKPLGRELIAIGAVERALEPLDMAERDRVLTWANARFGVNITQILSDLADETDKARTKQAADVVG